MIENVLTESTILFKRETEKFDIKSLYDDFLKEVNSNKEFDFKQLKITFTVIE